MARDPIERGLNGCVLPSFHADFGSAIKRHLGEVAHNVADPGQALHERIIIGTRIVVLSEVQFSKTVA